MKGYQTHSTSKTTVRSTFGKDRERAIKGIARNLTVDEWSSCKRQYLSGSLRVQAPRGYILSRVEVEAIAKIYRDKL